MSRPVVYDELFAKHDLAEDELLVHFWTASVPGKPYQRHWRLVRCLRCCLSAQYFDEDDEVWIEDADVTDKQEVLGEIAKLAQTAKFTRVAIERAAEVARQ